MGRKSNEICNLKKGRQHYATMEYAGDEGLGLDDALIESILGIKLPL